MAALLGSNPPESGPGRQLPRELHPIEKTRPEKVERDDAVSEVVGHKPDSQSANLRKARRFLPQTAVGEGDLDLEPLRGEARVGEDPPETGDQGDRSAELPGRDVDGDGKGGFPGVPPPGEGGESRIFQYPVGDVRAQTDAEGLREKGSRKERPLEGMVPANQRLDPPDFPETVSTSGWNSKKSSWRSTARRRAAENPTRTSSSPVSSERKNSTAFPRAPSPCTWRYRHF
jgi:hypothetical protein